MMFLENHTLRNSTLNCVTLTRKNLKHTEMRKELQKKVDFAIKLLQSIPQDGDIEISYSGGKDSDVILELAKMAGIPYRSLPTWERGLKPVAEDHRAALAGRSLRGSVD